MTVGGGGGDNNDRTKNDTHTHTRWMDGGGGDDDERAMRTTDGWGGMATTTDSRMGGRLSLIHCCPLPPLRPTFCTSLSSVLPLSPRPPCGWLLARASRPPLKWCSPHLASLLPAALLCCRFSRVRLLPDFHRPSLAAAFACGAFFFNNFAPRIFALAVAAAARCRRLPMP